MFSLPQRSIHFNFRIQTETYEIPECLESFKAKILCWLLIFFLFKKTFLNLQIFLSQCWKMVKNLLKELCCLTSKFSAEKCIVFANLAECPHIENSTNPIQTHTLVSLYLLFFAIMVIQVSLILMLKDSIISFSV